MKPQQLLNNLILDEDISLLALQEELVFDEKRKEILKSISSIDVQACPGSGKTTLIAVKLILLAKNWPSKYRGICVLSHTNVAKDEIIDFLKKSKTIEARKLLSYPHFIGTIQEFIHQFLVLPYLRSSGLNDFCIDIEEYVTKCKKLLENNEFAWFKGTLKGLGSQDMQDSFLRETHYFFAQDKCEVKINAKPRSWSKGNNFQRAKACLFKLKNYLYKDGFFLYKDMYFFADLSIRKNLTLCNYLQRRFPILFIDEMQDTQEFQDVLLQALFPMDSDEIIIQRFGDPDQAIFNGINGEKSNITYNKKNRKKMDFVIDRSHRFDSDFSNKIKNFSFNEVPLETDLTVNDIENRKKAHFGEGEFKDTIFIYQNENINEVIPKFIQLVSGEFSEKYKRSSKFIVKIVGAVGNKIDLDENGLLKLDQLKIGHYWENFDKTKAQKKFKENILIEAVYYCRQEPKLSWNDKYKALNGCFLSILRKMEKRDCQLRFFNIRTIKTYLIEKEEWCNYRKLIYKLLNSDNKIDGSEWTSIIKHIQKIFEIEELSDELKTYLEFNEGIPSASSSSKKILLGLGLSRITNNVIAHDDGFDVELSTIHGVKGETHDATLILETRFHCFDLSVMMPYLTGDRPNEGYPNTKLTPNPSSKGNPNQKFIKQLYVAMSRARHLLCFAIHGGRVKEEDLQKLEARGWNIEYVESKNCFRP